MVRFIISPKLYTLLLRVAVILAPNLLWFALPGLLMGVSIFDYVPGLDNDEVHYWHEILTFSRYGFRGGYYTIDELPAIASFSRFGPHGPAFPVIYGSVAHFVGWHNYSPLFFNSTLVSLALLGLLWLTQPNRKQTIYLILTVLTFFPLTLFISSAMQESLNQALAILMAGSLYSLLKKKAKRHCYCIVAATIVVASLIRFTWIFMLLPVLLIEKRTSSLYSFLRVVTLFFILTSFIILINRYWSSPFPNYAVFDQILSLDFEPILNNTFQNLRNIFSTPEINSGWLNQPKLGLLLRCQVLLVLVFSTTKLILIYRKDNVSNSSNENLHFLPFKVNALVVWIISHTVLLQVIFYKIDGYRDYRVIAPYLLIALVFLVLIYEFTVIKVVVLLNLLTIPLFISAYTGLNYFGADYSRQPPGTHRYVQKSMVDFETAVQSFMKYDNQSSGWCNTVIAPFVSYRNNLAGIPEGIGFSALLNTDKLQLPLKSKYLLLPDGFETRLKKSPRVRYLTSTPIGKLYLNLDSNCPHSTSL
jgi:hypothetical protein